MADDKKICPNCGRPVNPDEDGSFPLSEPTPVTHINYPGLKPPAAAVLLEQHQLRALARELQNVQEENVVAKAEALEQKTRAEAAEKLVKEQEQEIRKLRRAIVQIGRSKLRDP